MNAYCCECNTNEGTLFALYGPGLSYICSECIDKISNKTGEVALFSLRGIRFVSREKYEEMMKLNGGELE